MAVNTKSLHNLKSVKTDSSKQISTENSIQISKHLLKDNDFSGKELKQLFKTTDFLRTLSYKQSSKLLSGKTLGLIFEKSSTRTRVSFEVGMYQLGGTSLNLNVKEMQVGRGETWEDTALVLSRYLNGIMIRAYDQRHVEELAMYSSIPVINGLTDQFHPCQAYTDYYTMQEFSPKAKDLCYIGDANNNVAISLALTGAILGYDLTFCAPKEYQLPASIYQLAQELNQQSGGTLAFETDPQKAVVDKSFLYTDVWVSMGRESEAVRRKKDLANYAITPALLEKTRNAVILHCLPANWGEELSLDLRKYKNLGIYQQAENRLHVQKAILVSLIK